MCRNVVVCSLLHQGRNANQPSVRSLAKEECLTAFYLGVFAGVCFAVFFPDALHP